MFDESEVDKVLSRATELRKPLGKAWTVIILLFALWIVRKRGGSWTVLARTALLAVGAGAYGYWHGFLN
jgi:hypothetical protein